MEKPGGFFIQCQEALPFLPEIRVPALLGHLKPHPLGQQTHSIREREILDLHHEVDDSSALPATKAVVDLLIRARPEKEGVFSP